MQQVPLQPVPSQRVSLVLAGQNVQLFVRQMTDGIFVDIAVNGSDLALAVLARDVVTLNALPYGPFIGNLLFTDTQGTSDPYYTGLGSRFQLVYLP